MLEYIVEQKVSIVRELKNKKLIK